MSLFTLATVNILKEKKTPNNRENSEAERVGSDFDRGPAEAGGTDMSFELADGQESL